MKFSFAAAARRGLVFAFAMSTAPHGAAAGQLSLVMFEEAGCVWCARWDAEIGPAYPHTTEARAAPLERRDIHAPLPETLHLDSPPHFTPTFVLTDDGVEVGRIEGYPGPDFFWPMLDELIARVDPALVN